MIVIKLSLLEQMKEMGINIPEGVTWRIYKTATVRVGPFDDSIFEKKVPISIPRPRKRKKPKRPYSIHYSDLPVEVVSRLLKERGQHLPISFEDEPMASAKFKCCHCDNMKPKNKRLCVVCHLRRETCPICYKKKELYAEMCRDCYA